MHIDWNYIQDKFDWLGHIIEAVIQALVIAVLTWVICILWLQVDRTLWDAALLGGATAVGHFWGREKRDYEHEVKMPPPMLKSYFIWLWSFDGLTDFLPVLGVYTALCFVYLYTHSPLFT